MTLHKTPSQNVSPKVAASSVGASVSMIACYFLGHFVPFLSSLPTEVSVALFGLVTAAVTWGSGYAVKDVTRYAADHAPYGLGEFVTEERLAEMLDELATRITGEAPEFTPVQP